MIRARDREWIAFFPPYLVSWAIGPKYEYSYNLAENWAQKKSQPRAEASGVMVHSFFPYNKRNAHPWHVTKMAESYSFHAKAFSHISGSFLFQVLETKLS